MAESTVGAQAALRLAVASDDPRDGRWLGQLPYGLARTTPVFLVPAGRADLAPGGCEVREIAHATTRRGQQADFATLLDALDDLRIDACLVVGDGLFTRLVRLAADELGLAVFALVETEQQWLAIGRREKARPDLLLLASRDLLSTAQVDPRYGVTVLPVGHPGRDPELGQPAGSDSSGGSTRSVEAASSGAAGRLVRAIDRWRRHALEPEAPELSVVVPSYNEEQNVALVCDRLLAALESVPSEILIIDDLSRDKTFERAQDQMWRSSRVRAFSKPAPRGIGNGIRYGMDRSRARFIAVTMGDGSDEVSRLPEMLSKVRDEGYGLAIGSRYRHRANFQAVPRIYRFWSAIFRLTTRVVIGFRLADYTNAFRVFDRRIFDRYGPESGGFEISPEITFRAWFATGRVAEVDVRHLKRASGQSNFSFLRAGPGYGKILFKAFVQRVTGRWFVLDW